MKCKKKKKKLAKHLLADLQCKFEFKKFLLLLRPAQVLILNSLYDNQLAEQKWII